MNILEQLEMAIAKKEVAELVEAERIKASEEEARVALFAWLLEAGLTEYVDIDQKVSVSMSQHKTPFAYIARSQIKPKGFSCDGYGWVTVEVSRESADGQWSHSSLSGVVGYLTDPKRWKKIPPPPEPKAVEPMPAPVAPPPPKTIEQDICEALSNLLYKCQEAGFIYVPGCNH